MLFNKKKSKKLSKKISTLIVAFVIAASTGFSAFAENGESETNLTSTAKPTVEVSTVNSSNNSSETATPSVTTQPENTNLAAAADNSENKSPSGLYTPNANLYGDILVKEHNENDIDNTELKDETKYDTEHEKVYETKPGAKLDYMATINGKEVEKQYKEILENAKAKAEEYKKGYSSYLGDKGQLIDITDKLDSTLTLTITPNPMLEFPTAIENYILDAKDENGNVWYYIGNEDDGTDVSGNKKTIVMKLNFWNDKNVENKNRENGAVKIVHYSDLAPFIVGDNAKIKNLNLYIKGVKLSENAVPGENYTVESNLEGNFISNPSISRTLPFLGKFTLPWSSFTSIVTGIQEPYIEFKWKAIQETAQNDDLDGRDNILSEGDDNIWLTVKVPKVDNPVVPEEPNKPIHPIPNKPEKPNKPTDPTPNKPEKPSKPTDPTPNNPEEPNKPTAPTSNNSEEPKKQEEKNSKNKFGKIEKKKSILPQLGFGSLGNGTIILGAFTSVLSIVTLRKKK